MDESPIETQDPSMRKFKSLETNGLNIGIGILGGIIFLGLIFFLLNYFNLVSLSTVFPNQLGWLPHRNPNSFLTTFPSPTPLPGPYAFSINGNKISWDEYNKTVVFAKGEQGINNDKQAQKEAYENIIERFILKEEATKRNIAVTKADLEKTQAAKKSPLTNSEEYQLALQSAILKQKLEPFVVAKRDIQTIIVAFGFDRPELKDTNQKELALQLITQAYNRVISGESFETVGKDMDNNKQVQQLNNGIAYVEFKENPKQGVLFSQNFTDTIYTLKKPGDVTSIITLSNDPNEFGRKPGHFEFGYGIATISNISAGGSLSYESWLEAQKNGLRIQSYISL